MSTGIVNATTFFKDNGLFKLLKLVKGDMDKSYKTRNQDFIMECTKCGDQINQKGSSEFYCRRCRRSVVKAIDDGEAKWIIEEPTGKEKEKAQANLKKPPTILIEAQSETKKRKISKEKHQDKEEKHEVSEDLELPEEENHEEEDDEEDDEPAISKMPSTSDMISFLKTTTKKISGNRILAEKKAQYEEDSRDLSLDYQPVIPASKTKEKKISKTRTKDIPVVESTPKDEAEYMKVIRLKPGQSFYCKESQTMIVGGYKEDSRNLSSDWQAFTASSKKNKISNPKAEDEECIKVFRIKPDCAFYCKESQVVLIGESE